MRISKLEPEKFTQLQKDLYERIAGKRGQVRGPYLAWMHRPELCDIVEKLNSYFRWDSPITGRISELCILLTARYWDAAYSWVAHAPKAVEEGVSQEAVDTLALTGRADFTAEDERVFFRFADELLREHFVSDATYADAVRVFGEEGVIDMVGAIGAFSMLAMLLNVFQIDMHSGRREPFPDVSGYRRTGTKPR